MKKEESRQASSTIFEGMTSISAVINGGHRKIETVLADKEKAKKKSRELAYLRRCSEAHGFDINLCDSDEIDALTTGNTHGGIIALCSDRMIEPLSDELTREHGGFYVMLDGIEDPYNFGYALRTVYAAGADAVILTPRNWMNAAGVVCRASAGASELIPMYVGEADEVCRFFKDRGVRVVAAGIRNSVSAFSADLSLPLFLIVGGEKRGISAKTLDQADIVVRLDYGRDFRGSLSAASAASVLSYEILRQNIKK